jgi:beta-glucanase (GH16 family)
MPRLAALLLALVVAWPAAALDKPASSAPPEPPRAIRDKGYRIVKNWDFGATIRNLDELKGEFHTRFVYEGGKLDRLPANGEWQRYRDNDNYRIKDGALELVAHLRDGLKDGGIESGMLRSRWTGKYGYYECRMKVPPGRGMWPAFWLNPEDQKWPPEIDVVEIVNNGRDNTTNSFHNVHPGHNRQAPATVTRLDKWGSYRPGVDYKDGFHTFAVEWTPEVVRHFVDDVMVAERRMEWVHDDGSDAGPAHVLVNLAVGGKWPEAPTSPADFPAVLQVDYIRVWQKG